jgi:hypothetical protein
MHRDSRWFAVVAGALLSAGCVGGGKGLTSEDKERLKPYVLDSAPADIPHRLDVNFENKVHLIGYKFEPELAHPGEATTLTYYWRCDDTLEDGWMLFTHTKDEGNGKLGNLDFTGPIREQKSNGRMVLGPDRWEKGKVYLDVQPYTVPSDVTGAEVTILVGVWKGESRLRIISGPNDGDNSAIVGQIKTGVVPKPEHTANDVPVLSAVKLADNAKITIDGKASEPEWGGAASTGPFVDVGTGKPNTVFPVNGSAKLMWDAKNLYVYCEVQQAEPYMGFTSADAQKDDYTAAGQPKLWNKDTIEMMVDPDPSGDNRDYYELQINPQNKVFKSQFDTLQQPNGGPNGPFGHEDWDPKLKSAVQLKKGDDGKVAGYSVEIAIPWTAYAKAGGSPPKSGDSWRMNFYAMHQNAGVAWSPILGQGNFHHAPRFGRVAWLVPGEGLPVPLHDRDAGLAALMALARGDGGPIRLIPGHGILQPRPPVPPPAAPPQ